MSEKQATGPNTDRPELGSGGYSADQFSKALAHLEQWAGSYLGSLEERDVVSKRQPGETLAMLPEHPPESGEGMGLWERVGDELREIVEPGLVHWQSPNFFAYFPCSGSLPGVMGELASAVMNVNGMLWSTSPSATELEMRMVNWCAELFGLPDAFRFDAEGSNGGGCIQGTASEGVLAALCAARKRKVDSGRDRGTMCIYTSTQAHSSIVKAAMVAGLADGPDDHSRVRLIETDANLRMNPEALYESIERDLYAGLTPCLVSTTQGTTSTGAVDPLGEIGALLAAMPSSKRPWLHVDAAWGGVAAACPEFRSLLDGVGHADSLCINPHKWMLTNFDCDLFWVRDRDALTSAMSITPAYLHNEQSDRGGVVDFRDWHVPLGRRMRALKLWWVLRYFGVEGIREHIRNHVRLAWRFEQFVENEPRLRVVFERSLSLVCFLVEGEDGLTMQLIESINARGRVMISHTRVEVPGLGARFVARVAIGASGVCDRHLDLLTEEIGKALEEVLH
ncbi:MAG: aspartate aminotransferase family protein [Phycisphaerae bacterium]|nr:aspartate aminotransferase family protein [Phycisphaerae bacterium]MBM90045.1 aspartate aminotransferase family protein [Phycisphaerae bacterium]